MDELGYSDEEIIQRLDTSKGTIYNAKERLQPLIEALTAIESTKPTYGNPDVNAIVDAFKEAFGTTKTSQYDRYAAKRMATKHTSEAVVKVIQALSANGGEPFVPIVNSVQELEKKWVSVGNFLTEKSSNAMVEL